jgi:hypothetical protein
MLGIGGHGDLFDAVNRSQSVDNFKNILPQQRFPARDPHFTNTQACARFADRSNYRQ